MYVLTSEHLNFQFLQYCTYIGPSSQTGKLCAHFFSQFSCLTALSKNEILFCIPYVPTFDSSSKSMKSSFFWQPYMPRGPLTPPPVFGPLLLQAQVHIQGLNSHFLNPGLYYCRHFIHSLGMQNRISVGSLNNPIGNSGGLFLTAPQGSVGFSEQPYREQWGCLNNPIGNIGVF